MLSPHAALRWIVMVLAVVPLALLLLLAIPTGALASIAMHTGLLVGGAALVLSLDTPRDDD